MPAAMMRRTIRTEHQLKMRPVYPKPKERKRTHERLVNTLGLGHLSSRDGAASKIIHHLEQP